MKYFITWSYEGTEIYSHVYNFKYYINDADDFNYLKMEIASNHTIKGTDENPNVNDIHIINFVLLSGEEQTVTDKRYIYSIAYVVKNREKDMCEFYSKEMHFNTEIKTMNNIKDIFNRLEESTGKTKSDLALLNITLLEIIEDNNKGSTE